MSPNIGPPPERPPVCATADTAIALPAAISTPTSIPNDFFFIRHLQELEVNFPPGSSPQTEERGKTRRGSSSAHDPAEQLGRLCQNPA
jgi:hypothetical protein